MAATEEKDEIPLEDIPKTRMPGGSMIQNLKRLVSGEEQKMEHWDPGETYSYTIGEVEKYLAPDNKDTNRNVDLWFAKESGGKDKKGKEIKVVRKVFVSFKVKRISDIDNVKEQFRIKLHIYFNWLPTYNEYMEYIKTKNEGDIQTWEPKWYPQIEFLNKIQSIDPYPRWESYPDEGCFRVTKFKGFLTQMNDDPNPEFNCEDARFIRAKLDIEMICSEELELNSFPLDCQDLSVIMRESSTKQQVAFIPELRKPGFGSVDPRYSVIDEWDLDAARVEFGDTNAGSSRSNKTYPMFILRLKMKRRWQVFLWKVVVWLLTIQALSLTCFSLDAKNVAGDRMSLGITLVLTAVAFLHVVWASLPNVPYLTFLDKYVLSGYLFLVGVMVESSILAYLPDIDETQTQQVDRIFMFFAGIYLVVYNVFFIIYGLYLRRTELHKLVMNSDELEDDVELSRPSLYFDYRHAKRTGHNSRLLSFQAHIADE